MSTIYKPMSVTTWYTDKNNVKIVPNKHVNSLGYTEQEHLTRIMKVIDIQKHNTQMQLSVCVTSKVSL